MAAIEGDWFHSRSSSSKDELVLSCAKQRYMLLFRHVKNCSTN